MKYPNIQQGVFLSRKNRFIAEVLINGEKTAVHIKNTGRLTELLVPGAPVWLTKSANDSRKTAYDLVTVSHEDCLFNIDSTAPNAAAREWLEAGGPGFIPERIRPETVYGSSRFDYSFYRNQQLHYLEVKGVTLIRNGLAVFPDAPTARGAKHLLELSELAKIGIPTHLLFLIQYDKAEGLTANYLTDPYFADCLHKAHSAGVELLAYTCNITCDAMTVKGRVPVLTD